MALAVIAVLVFPTWFLVWVVTGFIVLLVAMAPFVVIWAVITFIGGLRRM